MRDIEKVMQRIEAGEIEQGLADLNILRTKGDDETKYSVAQMYYDLGHLEEAKAIVEELLFLYPDEGELYVFLSEILIDSGNEDEAVEMLLEVKENDPVFLQAQLLLADLYQMQGLDEVAEQKLLHALAIAPDEPIIAYGLGEFYLERGDYQKSIRLFRQVLQSQDQLPNMKVELRLAEAYSATGEFEQAIPYYESGLKESIEISALFGYGFTAFQIGNYPLAIEQFEKLKEVDPDYISLYSYLASAYEAELMYQEAIDTLQKGIEIDEFHEGHYVQLAKLYVKQQNPELAKSYFQKVLSLNPSHFEAARSIAAMFKHEESFDELLELIEYLKDYGEDDPFFTWYEASAHARLDSYEKAADLYKQIFTEFQEDPDFLEEYAFFQLENGLRDAAKQLLTNALSLDPSRLYLQETLDDLEEE